MDGTPNVGSGSPIRHRLVRRSSSGSLLIPKRFPKEWDALVENFSCKLKSSEARAWMSSKLTELVSEARAEPTQERLHRVCAMFLRCQHFGGLFKNGEKTFVAVTTKKDLGAAAFHLFRGLKPMCEIESLRQAVQNAPVREMYKVEKSTFLPLDEASDYLGEVMKERACQNSNAEELVASIEGNFFRKSGGLVNNPSHYPELKKAMERLKEEPSQANRDALGKLFLSIQSAQLTLVAEDRCFYLLDRPLDLKSVTFSSSDLQKPFGWWRKLSGGLRRCPERYVAITLVQQKDQTLYLALDDATQLFRSLKLIKPSATIVGKGEPSGVTLLVKEGKPLFTVSAKLPLHFGKKQEACTKEYSLSVRKEGDAFDRIQFLWIELTGQGELNPQPGPLEQYADSLLESWGKAIKQLREGGGQDEDSVNRCGTLLMRRCDLTLLGGTLVINGCQVNGEKIKFEERTLVSQTIEEGRVVEWTWDDLQGADATVVRGRLLRLRENVVEIENAPDFLLPKPNLLALLGLEKEPKNLTCSYNAKAQVLEVRYNN